MTQNQAGKGLRGRSFVADDQIEIWRSSRPMKGQWPLSLKKVDAAIESYTADCSCCGNDIPEENLRGTISDISDITPEGDNHRIDMLGFCEPCNRLTRYKLIFRSSGGDAILERHENGVWVSGKVTADGIQNANTSGLRSRLRKLVS